MIRSSRHLSQSVAILTAAAALVTTAGCARGEMSAANDSETGGQANVRVTNVEATPVVSGEFRGVIRVTGEVEALYDVTVSAEESGRIERFLVEKGRRVIRGQAIAKLESDLLTAQVNEARASARLASEEYERQRQLWEEDSIGTEMAFLQRRYASEMADARLSAGERIVAHLQPYPSGLHIILRIKDMGLFLNALEFHFIFLAAVSLLSESVLTR